MSDVIRIQRSRARLYLQLGPALQGLTLNPSSGLSTKTLWLSFQAKFVG